MAKLVHRLMAKRPSQRYQTPADLLCDLEALQRGEPQLSPRQALESLADETGEPKEPPRKKIRRSQQQQGRRTPSPSSGTHALETKSGKSTAEVRIASRAEPSPPYSWYVLGGAAARILIVTLTIYLSVRLRYRPDDFSEEPVLQLDVPKEQVILPDDPGHHEVQPDRPIIQPVKPDIQRAVEPPKQNGERTINTTPPKKLTWPVLYRPSQPIDTAALRKEVKAPWAVVPPSGPTVEFVVGRLPPDPAGKTFRSLAAASSADSRACDGNY